MQAGVRMRDIHNDKISLKIEESWLTDEDALMLTVRDSSGGDTVKATATLTANKARKLAAKLWILAEKLEDNPDDD